MKAHLKVTALVLAVLMAVSLFAGCNKDKDSDNGNLPAYIYNAEYNKLDIDAEDYYINYTTASSDAVYMLINVKDGETEVSYSYSDDSGNIYTNSYMQPVYVSRLFKVDTDGKNGKMLPDFDYVDVESDYNDKSSDTNSYSNINAMFVTNEGLPGMVYSISVTTFELPDDFDPETQNRWDFNSTNTMTYYYQTFDPETGKGSEPKVIAKVVDGDGVGAEYFAIDGDGNNYVGNWNGLSVYNPDFSEVLFTVSDDRTNINSLTSMSNGKVLACMWDENGMVYKPFDLAKGEFGDAMSLPSNSYNIFAGAGDYLLFNRSESGITGVKDGGIFEETVNWIDSDINSNEIYAIIPLENGDFICTTDSYEDDGTHTTELIKLVKKPYDPNAIRKVITMACIGMDYDVKNQVMEFNKNNTQYRIRMVDYSQYNSDNSIEAGITKLNTEIIAGHIPDIFCISSDMPIAQYAGKGVLEDLTPYMEKDFGKDAFVEDFFKTLRNEKGELFEIYGSFNIVTAVGLENVVGDGSSWTFADMKAAMEQLPEGATVLNTYYNRERAVQNFLYDSTSQFVDWETGKCSFDSEEFIDLLNFVKTFKTSKEIEAANSGERDYDEEYTKLNSGKQLLMEETISDFNNYRGNTYYVLNGAPSFVGYPGSGSSFTAGYRSGYAVSAKSQYKDIAWDFVKNILSEEYQNDNIYNGLPTNKAAFEKALTEAMTPEYIDPSEEAADGDYGIAYSTAVNDKISTGALEEPAEEVNDYTRYSDYNKGSTNEQGWKENPKTYDWYWDYQTKEEWQVPIFAMTEAEEQELRSLMSSITTFKRDDTSLRDIIDEETQAFFSGQKSAEDTAKMMQSRATIYVNEQK